MAPGSQNFTTTAAYSLGNSTITASTATDRVQPILDGELDTLQNHINVAADLCNRACHLADRLFGSAPSPIGKGENGAKPPDVVPVTVQLRAKQEVLQALLLQLNHQLNRLETL